LKDYFTTEEGTKVKISIELVFCIKRGSVYELSMHIGREGRGPLMCFSTSTRMKMIQFLLTNVVL